jgi:hypothetical protein
MFAYKKEVYTVTIITIWDVWTRAWTAEENRHGENRSG